MSSVNVFVKSSMAFSQESRENQNSFPREGYLTIIHRFRSPLNGQQIVI